MKYIRRFKVSSDYEAFKNSSEWITPNIVYINENSNLHLQPYVNDGEESGGGNLISFTIVNVGYSAEYGIEYQAEEGMTWEEWCSSEYNTDGWVVYNNQVRSSTSLYNNYLINEVTSTDIIIPQNYKKQYIGGAGSGSAS